MSRSEVLERLVKTYFASRPNLTLKQPQLCVFFLACSGSGKSTLRKQIVTELGASYVCNDEVRQLLAQNPEVAQAGIGLKEVVATTWQRMLSQSPNHFTVFDNNIIQYYKEPDSYLNVARKQKSPLFVIEIDVPKELLVARIQARQPDSELVALLDQQLKDFDIARHDLQVDFKVPLQVDMDKLLKALHLKLEQVNG